MWPMIFVLASSHVVTAVLTPQKAISNDESSGRNAHYNYYESQNSSPDTSSSFYTPVAHLYPTSGYTPVEHYYQQEGPKYHHDQTGQLCTWGNSLMDHIFQIGAAKLGLLAVLKAIITAVGAGFLTKLPLILFKLVALPVGIIVLGLPLLLPFLLPILAMFIPIPIISHHGHGSDECTDNSSDCDASRHRNIEGRVSRVLSAFMDSQACVGRLACELGNLNSKSEYKKPISWMLDYMQRSAPESEQAMLLAYRMAYLRGNDGNTCNSGSYTCDITRVVNAIYHDNETSKDE